MSTTISETCTQQDRSSDPPERLEPPAPINAKIENPLLLVLETIYFVLMIVPIIVYTVIENVFIKRPKSLKGKVVLVTGSGRGLGQGFALKFAKLGCKVACVDIDEVINEETVQMINEEYPGAAKGYVCNIAMSNEIRALREAVKQDMGNVDILVNNAGLIAASPSVTDFEDAYLHAVIAINLTSHFLMLREFLPDMIKRNEGHVVAVASVAGFASIAKCSMYTATKHGLVGLMDTLYEELQEIPNNNVQTSVVCPYFVNTSAFYTKIWDIRIPELSISEVVNKAVAGIRRNRRIITIPSYYYYVLHLIKMLPDRVNRMMKNIYRVKLNVPSMEVQEKKPLFKLVLGSMKDIDLGIDKFLDERVIRAK